MWRDCKKYPNWQVTEEGNVRRRVISIHDKMLKYERGGFIYPEKLKKNRSGYVCFGDRFVLHIAVASAFLPNPDNLPCVNHKDGDKSNNSSENLEWCTYKQNSVHAVTTGLIKTGKESHMFGKKGNLHPCSESNKGNTWNKGRIHTQETNTKISEKLRGNKNSLNHVVSEETRKVMSEKAILREQKKREKGKGV